MPLPPVEFESTAGFVETSAPTAPPERAAVPQAPPPVLQPPGPPQTEVRPRVNRVAALRAIYQALDQATMAGYNVWQVVGNGWEGMETDTPQTRRQLEMAMQELQSSAQRMTAAANFMLTVKRDPG